MSFISVLVPAFNEAENIKMTVNSLCDIEMLDEIIVIDDGSKDGTPEQLDKINEKKLILLREKKSIYQLQI